MFMPLRLGGLRGTFIFLLKSSNLRFIKRRHARKGCTFNFLLKSSFQLLVRLEEGKVLSFQFSFEIFSTWFRQLWPTPSLTGFQFSFEIFWRLLYHACLWTWPRCRFQFSFEIFYSCRKPRVHISGPWQLSIFFWNLHIGIRGNTVIARFYSFNFLLKSSPAMFILYREYAMRILLSIFFWNLPTTLADEGLDLPPLNFQFSFEIFSRADVQLDVAAYPSETFNFLLKSSEDEFEKLVEETVEDLSIFFWNLHVGNIHGFTAREQTSFNFLLKSSVVRSYYECIEDWKLSIFFWNLLQGSWGSCSACKDY